MKKKSTHSKRILLFIDSLGSGGAQRQVVELARLLCQKGYHVKVITYYEISFYLSILENEGIEYENINVGKSIISRFYSVKKSIEQFNPSTVISHLDTPNILSCLIKMCNSRWNLIVSERNTNLNPLLKRKEKIKFWLYRFADYIVSNSSAQNNFIRANFPSYKHKTRVINNVIDLTKFHPATKNSLNDIPQILSVGRNVYQKNYLGMVEAVKILKEHNFKAHFNWYAGIYENDNYYRKVYSKIKEYDLGEMISIYSPTQDIVDQYRKNDYFWLASFYEGFPNALCEAMACGLPIACSNICDNPEIVQEDENGVLFNPNDPEEMALKILKITGFSKEKLFDIRNANIDKIKKICSSEVFIAKYINLIQGEA